MRKVVLLSGTVAAALLFWAACDRVFDPPSPERPEEPGEMEYLSFLNHGCQEGPETDGGVESLPRLSGYRLAGDTLTLTIRHLAQCCAAFRDSVSIQGTTVDIALADTAMECDCICEFAGDFTFSCPEPGPLRVRFGWIGGLFELDTLIQTVPGTTTYSFVTDANAVQMESFPRWPVSRDALAPIGIHVLGIQTRNLWRRLDLRIRTFPKRGRRIQGRGVYRLLPYRRFAPGTRYASGRLWNGR